MECSFKSYRELKDAATSKSLGDKKIIQLALAKNALKMEEFLLQLFVDFLKCISYQKKSENLQQLFSR